VTERREYDERDSAGPVPAGQQYDEPESAGPMPVGQEHDEPESAGPVPAGQEYDERESAEPVPAGQEYDEREGPGPVAASGDGDGGTVATAGPLLGSEEAERFRARWADAQTVFVDAPRQAVAQADKLVAEVMQDLEKTFAETRSDLERQWDRGDDVSTDELRGAFQRYRSFFERLLAT
jgi:hypothetical protein